MAETGGKSVFLIWASGLRFPWLFALTVALFVFDLAVPDLIPFVDEILLGLAALLVGSFRKRRVAASHAAAKTIDVEPLQDSPAPPDQDRP